MKKIVIAPAIVLCVTCIIPGARAYDPTKVYPVQVIQSSPRTPMNKSPFWGPPKWGFDMATDLMVKDNQNKPWTHGDMHETFSDLSIKPACPSDASVRKTGAGSLNNNGRNGWWYLGSNVIGGSFIDYNLQTTSIKPKSPTAYTGRDQWYSIKQTWHAYYGTGNAYYGKYARGWDLNTMSLSYHQTYYTRTPGF